MSTHLTTRHSRRSDLTSGRAPDSQGRGRKRRRGTVAPLTAVLMVPLLGITALGVDIGYVALVRAQLQAAADSAAMAASAKLIANRSAEEQQDAIAAAQEFAADNTAGGKSLNLNLSTDVEIGFWNAASRTLEPPRDDASEIKVNAVRVITRREDGSSGGSVSLFFARMFGISDWDVRAEAVAYVPSPISVPNLNGGGTRFLIDDEMFDTDEAAIIALANSLGKTPEWVLSAKNEKSADMRDWFLNIPAGRVLDLPTGQVGDEGLLDISATQNHPSLPQYPFSDPQDHYEFMQFNKTSENDGISALRRSFFTDPELDPLNGVGRFNQPSLYPELVDPDFIHVSPVFKSDISALDGVKSKDEKAGPDLNGDGKPDGYTTNESVQKGVAAKDYRRGLVAFKIVGYRIDPNRKYPYLPNLIIEIVDPQTIDLSVVRPVTNPDADYKALSIKNVRLVE